MNLQMPATEWMSGFLWAVAVSSEEGGDSRLKPPLAHSLPSPTTSVVGERFGHALQVPSTSLEVRYPLLRCPTGERAAFIDRGLRDFAYGVVRLRFARYSTGSGTDVTRSAIDDRHAWSVRGLRFESVWHFRWVLMEMPALSALASGESAQGHTICEAVQLASKTQQRFVIGSFSWWKGSNADSERATSLA